MALSLLCRCENVKVRFQQRDIDRESWESVDPGHSVDYAWEEPNMAHKLCVSLETEGVAFRDASEHEYNLDVIKVCIKFSASLHSLSPVQ